MTESELVALLLSGASGWNQHRPESVDLPGAKLRGANLADADLSRANLRSADLRDADLRRADLSDADLRDVDMRKADLSGATLLGARLSSASLGRAQFAGADLSCADLSEVNARKAGFRRAKLHRVAAYQAKLDDARFSEAVLTGLDADSCSMRRATLSRADLAEAWLGHSDLTNATLRNARLVRSVLYDSKLVDADLRGADLTDADLRQCTVVGTDLAGATLKGCSVFGASVWNIQGVPADQTDLLVLDQPPGADGSWSIEEEILGDVAVEDPECQGRQPWGSNRLSMTMQFGDPTLPVEVRVDDLEVAQFVFLLLTAEKLRTIIETVTSKVVLILGRFSPERRVVLDALADQVRANGLMPVIFDFERATTRDLTETVHVLAGMCLFVVVDITNPRSAPLELQATVPEFEVPFIPIIEAGEEPFAMFADLMKHDWVSSPLAYSSVDELAAGFKPAILDEALRVRERLLERKRRTLRTRNIGDYLD